MLKRLLQTLNGSARELSVTTRGILLKEGQVADTLYYVRDGCLRLTFNKDGRDITFQFFFPGSVVASFDSLHSGTPSLFSLEAIETSSLVAIDGSIVRELIRSDSDVHAEYDRLLAERFHAYQKLFLSRIRDTPQQRYEELLKENPEYVNRIPQHYIASFLGITPVSLSRIRSRLAKSRAQNDAFRAHED